MAHRGRPCQPPPPCACKASRAARPAPGRPRRLAAVEVQAGIPLVALVQRQVVEGRRRQVERQHPAERLGVAAEGGMQSDRAALRETGEDDPLGGDGALFIGER